MRRDRRRGQTRVLAFTQGGRVEAETLGAEAIERMARAVGMHHPETRLAVENLAVIRRGSPPVRPAPGRKEGSEAVLRTFPTHEPAVDDQRPLAVNAAQ